MTVVFLAREGLVGDGGGIHDGEAVEAEGHIRVLVEDMGVRTAMGQCLEQRVRSRVEARFGANQCPDTTHSSAESDGTFRPFWALDPFRHSCGSLRSQALEIPARIHVDLPRADHIDTAPDSRYPNRST